MTQHSPIAKYKSCALAALAIIFFFLLPQIHLWIVRGRDCERSLGSDSVMIWFMRPSPSASHYPGVYEIDPTALVVRGTGAAEDNK